MSCGVLHERDENAAKNIRRLGLEILSTESSSGINACGVAGRPALSPELAEGSKGRQATVKQEASTLIIFTDVINDKTCGTAFEEI